MPVRRLNHAVLYVRDAQRSSAFYRQALGMEERMQLAGGRAVFLRSAGTDNDHDLGLFSVGDEAGPTTAGRASVGLYHLAWQVGTLAELVEVRDRLQEQGCMVGSSDHSVSKSLYATDPDGIEFEVMWAVPQQAWDEALLAAAQRILPLDLDVEIARWGADLASA
jgi:catechol-2,3-dioxygenase